MLSKCADGACCSNWISLHTDTHRGEMEHCTSSECGSHMFNHPCMIVSLLSSMRMAGLISVILSFIKSSVFSVCYVRQCVPGWQVSDLGLCCIAKWRTMVIKQVRAVHVSFLL